MRAISKIYLHWSATNYYWAEYGYYHTVVQGDGTVKRLTGYERDLPAHTYRRNTNSLGLCVACMGGDITWGKGAFWEMPPTQKQIDALCLEVANIAKALNWTTDMITAQRVMTHAEAASNRDGWNAHVNYGPAAWGGTSERWDLWMLSPGEPAGSGGDRLRDRIKQYMELPPTIITSQPKNKITVKSIDGKVLEGQIWADRSYLPISDLAKLFGFAVAWNPDDHAVYLTHATARPKYAANMPLAPGFPATNVYLGSDRPVLGAILIDGRAWVQVSEFCNEFAIPCLWNPEKKQVELGQLSEIPE